MWPPILLLPVLAVATPGVFDVTSFGAVGNGVTVNAKPINDAVAAAAAYYVSTGQPGVVLVPAGVFLSGQIQLLSGTSLTVTPAARLLGSANVSDYPPTEWSFIYSNGATGITINGGGVIDGNWEAYIGGFDATNDEFVYQGWPGCTGECRPRLAVLSNSFDIVVANVTFTGSADWTFQLLNCSRVHVYNWTQHGDERWPNNDGIDIDSSSNVLLEDSTIDTADDGVCIKGSAVGGVVANVTVRRCSIRSRSSAVKFGSNCPIPMYNLTFEDLYVHDSNRGLAIQARDGGTISNVTFARILINGTRLWPYHWWGDGSALYISTMLRTAADPGSVVSGVVFRDIVAYSQTGAVFSGDLLMRCSLTDQRGITCAFPLVYAGRAPGKTVHNVLLQNVTIVIDKWLAWNYSTASTPAVSPNIE
jgi:polygalacturonase